MGVEGPEDHKPEEEGVWPGSEDLDLSDEDKRLELINRRAFERAVTKATKQATQNVAQVHRRRLVWYSSITTTILMALLGFLIVYFIFQNNNAEERANARFNCTLFTQVANDQQQFISIDAALRRGQTLNQRKIAALRPGELKRLFQDPQTIKLSKQSTIAEKDAIHFWVTFLVPNLRHLAEVNCNRAIH